MDTYVREQLAKHRDHLQKQLDEQHVRKGGLEDMVRLATQGIAETKEKIASVDAVLADA